MSPAQIIQQLLRDAEHELQQAREGMHVQADAILTAQQLRSAGESFIAAADEMAVEARRTARGVRRV